MDMTNEQWQRIAEYIPKPKALPASWAAGQILQHCMNTIPESVMPTGTRHDRY